RGVHRGGVDDAAGRGGQVGVAARPGQGAGLPGDVAGAVGVQHDHVVGDVEVVAAGAHDQHGGDAVEAVQRPDEVDGGDEGLAVAVHQPLHALVADHQVGGGGVLVHQQHGGPGLQGLGDVGGLGGGAGGVVGGEVGGVGSGGQVAHERADVGAHHAAPLLGADLHGVGAGDDEFAAVSGHVVVDAALQGVQQGRLAVEAAADDEGDALGHPHAGNRSPVRQLHGDAQALGGGERDGVRHRQVADAAGAGQDRAVADEGDEPQLGEAVAQRDGVGDAVGEGGGRRGVQGVPAQGVDEVGDGPAQGAAGAAAVDAAAVSGQVHAEPQQDRAVADLAGGAVEDLLSAGVDAHPRALERPAGAAGQVVGGGAAAHRVAPGVLGHSRGRGGHVHQ